MTLPLYSFSMGSDRNRRNGSQFFAAGVSADDVLASQYMATYDYWRSLRQQVLNGFRETAPKVKSDKNRFQLSLDVKDFTLEELSVKTVDGFILIQAKHGDKKDNQGWVSRQFTRKYQLPEGCNAENVQCRLSFDGFLTVTVPLERNQKSNERVVPIIQTGFLKNRFETKVEDEEEKRECGDEDTSEKTPVGNGE